MPYEVEIDVALRTVVVVHGQNLRDAERIAHGIVARRLDKFGAASPVNVHAFARGTAPEGARSETYVCPSCDEAAPKERWGPGWITCPSCGERLPSAGEVAAKLVRLVEEHGDTAQTAAAIDIAATFGYETAVKLARATLAARIEPCGCIGGTHDHG
jgi:ribosomal protein L37AE/L43A